MYAVPRVVSLDQSQPGYNGADNTVKAGDKNEIPVSGLVISGVEQPEAGKPLDNSATVTSAEGIQWEIPVIWYTADGRAATIAESGITYRPPFVFLSRQVTG